jgi:hypothetical protein
MLNAIAFPAWFGLIVTMINLLPIGQLDGGHVIFSMFGRVQWKVAVAAEIILLVLGMYIAFTTGQVFNVWLLWAILVQVFGLRHPPPLDDLTPLDRAPPSAGRRSRSLPDLTPLPFCKGEARCPRSAAAWDNVPAPTKGFVCLSLPMVVGGP